MCGCFVWFLSLFTQKEEDVLFQFVETFNTDLESLYRPFQNHLFPLHTQHSTFKKYNMFH